MHRRLALLLIAAILVLVIVGLPLASAATSTRIDESTDYVDNNSSDVDGHADHGTHSAFANEQAAPDATYDTLTEADTGVATNYHDYVDAVSNLHAPTDFGTHSSFAAMQAADEDFDTLTEMDNNTGTGTFGDTSGSGTSYLTPAADTMYLGVYTSAYTGYATGCAFYGRGSTATVNVKSVITDSGGTILTNGISNALSVTTTAGTKTTVYSAGSQPWIVSGQTYWIGFIPSGALRIYYDSTTGGSSKYDSSNSYTSPTSPTDATSGTYTWRLCYANLAACNYGMDLEVGWTAAPYSETNEYLCILAGDQNAEACRVDVWTGSVWLQVIADIAGTTALPQWNNVSVSSYLTSAAFEVRFRDSTASSDNAQGTWLIDAAVLHCWTAAVANYELDLEIQWTAADFDESVEQIDIYCGSQDAEALKLYVWNSTNLQWYQLSADLQASQWNNFTVTNTIGSATVTLRFLGGTEASDSVQSTWQIDCSCLHVYSTAYADTRYESLALADSLVSALIRTMTLFEQVITADAVQLTMTLGRLLFETLAMAGTATMIISFSRLFTDTLPMIETLATLKSGLMTLALYDLLPVTETLTVTKSGLWSYTLYDWLLFAENTPFPTYPPPTDPGGGRPSRARLLLPFVGVVLVTVGSVTSLLVVGIAWRPRRGVTKPLTAPLRYTQRQVVKAPIAQLRRLTHPLVQLRLPHAQPTATAAAKRQGIHKRPAHLTPHGPIELGTLYGRRTHDVRQFLRNRRKGR